MDMKRQTARQGDVVGIVGYISISRLCFLLANRILIPSELHPTQRSRMQISLQTVMHGQRCGQRDTNNESLWVSSPTHSLHKVVQMKLKPPHLHRSRIDYGLDGLRVTS